MPAFVRSRRECRVARILQQAGSRGRRRGDVCRLPGPWCVLGVGLLAPGGPSRRTDGRLVARRVSDRRAWASPRCCCRPGTRGPRARDHPASARTAPGRTVQGPAVDQSQTETQPTAATMSPTTCSTEHCGRPTHSRGLCSRCYLARWRAGQFDPPSAPPRVDLVGRRFSDLVVTGWDSGRRRWRCECDCGRSRLVRAGRLTGGEVRSCGHHHARRPRSPDG
ncbi:hypothetical protein SAMN05445060_3488 [Williamsia sterculiae]|uniref:Uncharacterized protein n=1 Tax=Williamsia sterculiae TaxID=1344003 RepID=A0A1N7H3W1_9NOCA|nr:hypothetical protein SAMN05445060_3488 [Williamsia sterculiae]